MRVKGIFFDLGGTLFSYTGRQGGNGIGYLLKAAQLRLEPQQIGAAWGKASALVGARYGAMPYFLHKDLFRETATAFLAEFDREVDAAIFEEFHQRQLQGMLQHLPIRDDCHATLAALGSRGIYRSIVSNIDDDYLDPLVELHNLDQHLEHWTSSEEAQSCKPDPDIYHYCLGKSGLGIEEVLFVGDSLHHDVAGAAKVGMRSVRIYEDGVATPLTHGLEVTAQPTYQIGTLSELLAIVDELNG
ncbi:MAG: HAD family hydrolase [Pseudomonadota bacterium]